MEGVSAIRNSQFALLNTSAAKRYFHGTCHDAEPHSRYFGAFVGLLMPVMLFVPCLCLQSHLLGVLSPRCRSWQTFWKLCDWRKQLHLLVVLSPRRLIWQPWKLCKLLSEWRKQLHLLVMISPRQLIWQPWKWRLQSHLLVVLSPRWLTSQLCMH